MIVESDSSVVVGQIANEDYVVSQQFHSILVDVQCLLKLFNLRVVQWVNRGENKASGGIAKYARCQACSILVYICQLGSIPTEVQAIIDSDVLFACI